MSDNNDQVTNITETAMTRRTFLKVTGAGLASAALGGIAFAATGCAPQTATPTTAPVVNVPAVIKATPTRAIRKVTLVYGVQPIDVDFSFASSIPKAMGYFEEEGLDVTVQAINGASAAVQLLTTAQTEFTSHGTPGLFSAVGQGIAAKGFICQIPDYFVSVAVLKNGPIKSFEQLKGKTIGINAEGGSPHLVMKGVLNKLGWDANKDIQFLAVGTTLPALDALQKDRVQALALWDTILGQYEAVGAEFTYFRPDPIPSMGFTHSTNALVKTIENSPEIVRGMARAQAKALVFTAGVDPTELVKLHYKVYPEAKPTGMSDEEAMRIKLKQLAARSPNYRFKQRVFDRTEKLGDSTDQAIEIFRDLMVDAGQLKQGAPAATYFTRQFVPDMNSIDFDAILKTAKVYKA